MPRVGKTVINHWAHFWTRLTKPSPSVEESGHYRQAQFLSSILVLLVLLIVLAGIIPYVLSFNYQAEDLLFREMAASAAILAGLYLLSRTRYYTIAAVLTILTISAATFVMVLSTNQSGNFVYLVVPVLLASMLLSLNSAVLLTIGQLGGILLVQWYDPDITSAGTWIVSLASISALMLVAGYHRLLLERERQAKLHESIVRYERMFKGHPAIMLLIDPQTGKFVDANPAACEFYGYSHKKLTSLSIKDINTLPDEEVQDNIISVLDGQQSVFFFTHTLASGEIRDVEVRSGAIPISGKQFLYSIVHDISQRKQAEEALHEKELNLQQRVDELARLYHAISVLFIADNVTDLAFQIATAVVRDLRQVDCSIFLLDQNKSELIPVARAGEYIIEKTNRLSLHKHGLVAEAIHTRQIIYTPDVTSDERYLVGDARTRSELVVPLRTFQGVIGAIDLQSPELDAFDKENQRIIITFAERAASALERFILFEQLQHTITELEDQVARRTNQLQRIAERVTSILNNSSDGIILMYNNGIIRQVNFAFEKMFGYQEEEVFGKPVGVVLAPDEQEKVEMALQNVAEKQSPQRLEIVGQRADATTFHADFAFAFLPEEQAAGVICSIRDISERVKAEKALRMALEREKELAELKSRFVSTVSHEFRTPLTAIQLAVSTLENYFDRLDDRRREKRFTAIYSQIDQLTNLMEDVLTVGRNESGRIQFEPVEIDLYPFCADIIEDFDNITAGTHEVACPPIDQPIILQADPKLLRQIMTNLISNAIKYSPEGGQIQVKLSEDEQAVTIQVKDNGIGIPEEDLPLLFTAFHRGHNVGSIKGTGLGLLIMKHAIEQHGGTISVTSTENKGSTFIVTLSKTPVVEL